MARIIYSQNKLKNNKSLEYKIEKNLEGYTSKRTLTVEEIAALETPDRPDFDPATGQGEKLTTNHFRRIMDYRYHYIAVVWSKSNGELDTVRDCIKQTVDEFHRERPLLSEAVKLRRAELNAKEREEDGRPV